MQIGELVLQDNSSKFGTHLMIQRPVQLFEKQPIFVLNGLSLLRLELLKDEQGCCKRFTACFGKDSQQKYLRDQHLIYEDVKYSMPHDLMRYRAEEQNIPASVRDAWFKRYNQYTVHLMPIIRSSYYIKQMPVFEECSSDSSFRDNTEDEKNKKDASASRV